MLINAWVTAWISANTLSLNLESKFEFDYSARAAYCSRSAAVTQFKRFNWYRTFDQSNDSLISAYHSHTNHSRCPASPLFTTTTSSTSCPPSFCVSLLLSVNWWHFRRLELYSLWSQICLSPQCVMPHCSEPSEKTRSKHMLFNTVISKLIELLISVQKPISMTDEKKWESST